MFGRAHTLARGLSATLMTCALSSAPASAFADQVLTFDGTVAPGGLDHELIEVQVPDGFQELEVDHQNLTTGSILDWGLMSPTGFRGWGGGNAEPAVTGALAASRSYLAGPVVAGTWKVVIGKAKLLGAPANYHVVVTLREAPTLVAQTDRAPYVAASPLSNVARWYAGDLHVHSVESGDARPPLEEVVTFAKSQRLDFVELSDHNTISQLDFINGVQAHHGDLLLLPGVEFTTYAGHANGIGATSWVDHKIGQPGVTIDGAAAAFRAQGALFSINHPLYDLGDACIGCSWGYDLPADAVDAVEIATAGTSSIFGDETLAFWDKLSENGRHLAAVGGSDDHQAGQKIGAFGTAIGTPTTYVFANDLSVASIIDGIKNGRTVVKINGVADPMVELSSEIGSEGDTVSAENTVLHAKISGAGGLSARWVENGVRRDPIDITSDPMTLDLAVDAPKSGQDRYRIEVLRDGQATTVTSNIWLQYKAGVKGVTEPKDDKNGCGCEVASNGEGDDEWFRLAACALVIGVAATRVTATRRRRTHK